MTIPNNYDDTSGDIRLAYHHKDKLPALLGFYLQAKYVGIGSKIEAQGSRYPYKN